MKEMIHFFKRVFALSILVPLTGCQSAFTPTNQPVSAGFASTNLPKIGIIYNHEQAEQLQNGGHPLDNYTRAIEENGGTVIILSPLLSKRETQARLDSLDALLIPGGDDVNPARYHEKPDPKLEACDNELDAYEFKALDRAAARGIEILGICRGLQVLNVWAGGTLWQDLPSELGANVIHRRLNPSGDVLPCYHDITVEPGSFLWTQFGTNRLTVNSYHHQGVDQLAGRFHTVARSDDGLVEAFADQTGNIRAVQFHPERLRLEPGFDRFNAIFSDFVARAASPAQKRNPANADPEAFYQNPVIPGDHPDPSIIRVGRDYWASCTSSAWGPMFPLLHSSDLVNWQQTGAVFSHRPAWAIGDFWAPEISEFNGKFFVYYVGRQKDGRLAVAVATASRPGGPYTDRGSMVAQDDGSIDPAPVTDTNGQRYLIWKEDGNSRGQPTSIWAQRLNDNGTKLLGEPHELIRNDAPWEGGVVEGPYILYRHGWFYLFYSGNGCCGGGCSYALGVARARHLLGPWEKYPLNPILTGNEAWKCPGHGSVVQDERGRYFFLYHAYSTTGGVFTGRQGMLDEVRFGPDDWPTINNGNGPSIRAPSPYGAIQQSHPGYTGNFTRSHLDSGWQWPQQREPVCRLQNGTLLLAAGGPATNFLAAVLARSTTALDYLADTAFETSSLKPGCAVGLCAFGDSENAMGAAFCDGQIITWRRDNGHTRELARQPAPVAANLHLRLTSHDGYRFQFDFSADGQHWQSCGAPADAKNLPPWDRSVRVALTVGGIPNAAASFDSFSLRPL